LVHYANQAQKVLDRNLYSLFWEAFLESDPNIRAKNQIAKELTKHQGICKSAIFRGAVTRRSDIAELRNKWLLYLGVIKLAESKLSFQLRQYITRNRFLVFEAPMEIRTLIRNLEQLCIENKFNFGKVVIEFPQPPSIRHACMHARNLKSG